MINYGAVWCQLSTRTLNRFVVRFQLILSVSRGHAAKPGVVFWDRILKLFKFVYKDLGGYVTICIAYIVQLVQLNIGIPLKVVVHNCSKQKKTQVRAQTHVA